MRFLSVLGFVRVHARLVCDVLGAVQITRLVAGRIECLLRQLYGVGSHIGDEAVLVKALRDAHGALRSPAIAVGSFLLQCRGDERGFGLALLRLLHDRANGELASGQVSGQSRGYALIQHDHVGLLRAPLLIEVTRALSDLLAVDRVEASLERLGVEDSGDVPVARGLEGDAFTFAMDHETHRDGLHATG